MSSDVDKTDVAEALADIIDEKLIPGLGLVYAGVDSENDGTIVIQTWPDRDSPSVDFLCRITRYRPRPE